MVQIGFFGAVTRSLETFLRKGESKDRIPPLRYPVFFLPILSAPAAACTIKTAKDRQNKVPEIYLQHAQGQSLAAASIGRERGRARLTNRK